MIFLNFKLFILIHFCLKQSQGEFEQVRSIRTNEVNPDSRGSASRFTVSLPLIKLEIPYDEGGEFLDIQTNNHRPLSSTDLIASSNEENIPDLIQSTRRPFRTCKSNSHMMVEKKLVL